MAGGGRETGGLQGLPLPSQSCDKRSGLFPAIETKSCSDLILPRFHV